MQNTKEFLLSNEVRKANYHTYKRKEKKTYKKNILIGSIMREVYRPTNFFPSHTVWVLASHQRLVFKSITI